MELETGYTHLTRLSDVGHVDVLAATTSQEECATLLRRLAEISEPGPAARVFIALFDQLAVAGASGWLEGDLAVELFDEDGVTRVRVMSELGGGLREQVLPTVAVRAPLDDMTNGYEPVALHVEQVSSRCALLLSSEPVPTSTAFEISQTCLALGAGVHEDVDAGWDA
jgi:hypothetical protein